MKAILNITLISKRKISIKLDIDFSFEEGMELIDIDDYISDNQLLSEVVYEYGHIEDYQVIGYEESEFDPVKEYEGNFTLVNKQEIKDKKFLENIENFSITKKDIKFNEQNNKLEIKTSKGKIRFNVSHFYDLIDQDIEHEELTLTNSFGEKIFSFVKASMLNAGLAHIQVFRDGIQKGGIYIRDNGFLCIGDMERTKYLRINLTALIKEITIKKLNNKKFLENLKEELK